MKKVTFAQVVKLLSRINSAEERKVAKATRMGEPFVVACNWASVRRDWRATERYTGIHPGRLQGFFLFREEDMEWITFTSSSGTSIHVCRVDGGWGVSLNRNYYTGDDGAYVAAFDSI